MASVSAILELIPAINQGHGLAHPAYRSQRQLAGPYPPCGHGTLAHEGHQYGSSNARNDGVAEQARLEFEAMHYTGLT